MAPHDHRLLVTDEGGIPGRVVLFDLEKGEEAGDCRPGRVNGEKEPPGRNPYRVCHHPVFSRDGRRILANAIAPGEECAQPVEIELEGD
ncbi:MAG: hypothetical protein D6820_17630 [Lentisphaerae bacterium]|nr:MAG: hypothetical protein D6820_17630 [Lentisphaerota bacterium]